LVEQATDITVDDCYECRPAPETMEEDIETDDSTTDDDDDDNQGAVHGRIAHPPPDSLCRAEMHLVGVAAEEPAMTEDIADSMARAETAAELDEQLGGVDELDTELGRNDAYEQTLEMDAADDEEPVGGVTWAVEGNGSDDDDDMDDEELGTPEHDEF